MVALSWLLGCSAYDEYLLERDLSWAVLAAGSGGTPARDVPSTPARDASSQGGAGAPGGAGSLAGGGRAGAAPRAGRNALPAGDGGSAAGKPAAGSGGTADAGSTESEDCVPQEGVDCCPDDPTKQAPGACGCGVPDSDADRDGSEDCEDAAPFGWQRQLVIDGAQVAGALKDFVLLVRITDPHLRDFAAEDGTDIYFAAGDRTTALDFEIESYAADSGALVAWVRVPSLNAGEDSVLYMGYEDGGSRRANAAGVWSAYRHVWHLGEDPSAGSGSIKDATGRSHGTARGGMTTTARVPGVAASGLSFDGQDDEVTYTNDVTGSGPSTLSGWVHQAADGGDNGASIISFGNGALNRSRFLLGVAEQKRMKVGFYGNDKQPQTELPRDTWKHVAWVWTGSESTVYVDGVAVFGPAAHARADTVGASGSIGGTTFGYAFFMTGLLDEVRVATDARSAASLQTEFNNQRPGATFVRSLGDPQAAPAH